ncbi:MAG: hypothetical protein RBT06_05810 [Smithellaceae bacterium]|jgi:hypothetical protein|nr:hypothetical protein [Smithellaceae bacterium]
MFCLFIIIASAVAVVSMYLAVFAIVPLELILLIPTYPIIVLIKKLPAHIRPIASGFFSGFVRGIIEAGIPILAIMGVSLLFGDKRIGIPVVISFAVNIYFTYKDKSPNPTPLFGVGMTTGASLLYIFMII